MSLAARGRGLNWRVEHRGCQWLVVDWGSPNWLTLHAFFPGGEELGLVRRTGPARAREVSGVPANEASRRLGCGAKPLKPPTGKVYREPQPVAPNKAAATPCNWMAHADLPTRARVSVSGTRASHAVRCDLHWGAKSRYPKVMLGAWYGDWGKRLRYDGEGRRLPGTVTARCRGEAVTFKATATRSPPASRRSSCGP